ncbi:hypothetical protein ACFLU9_01935 [Chloroflexota bacterium]
MPEETLVSLPQSCQRLMAIGYMVDETVEKTLKWQGALSASLKLL